MLAEENCGSHPDQESHPEHEPGQWPPPTHGLEPHPQTTPSPTPTSSHFVLIMHGYFLSLIIAYLVNNACLYSLLFVTYLSQTDICYL